MSVRWFRLSEQIFRLDKWSVCWGLGCQAEWQRLEVGSNHWRMEPLNI
jgi:hypothetical protein